MMVVSLLSIQVLAQVKQPELGGLENQVINDMAGNPGSSVMRTYNYNYDGVKGTPYFLEEFVEAKIIFNSGKELQNVYANYDVHKDELMIMRKKGGEILILDREFVKGFQLLKIGDDEYRYSFQGEVAGKKLDGRNYIHVLHAGSFTLLHQPGKMFKKANLDPTPYSGGSNYDEFFDKHAYMIVNDAGELEELKINRKVFLQLFPKIEGNIKQYWKENDVQSKDPESVRMLADFIERSLSKL